jgi:hypothetical protein
VPETRLAPYTSNGDKRDKSLTTQVTELWELVKTYVKQETVEPIKGLGRFVGYGVAGALCLAMGLLLLLLATLRALQTETGPHLQGSWSWVPYLATLVVAAVVAYISARQIQKRNDGKG